MCTLPARAARDLAPGSRAARQLRWGARVAAAHHRVYRDCSPLGIGRGRAPSGDAARTTDIGTRDARTGWTRERDSASARRASRGAACPRAHSVFLLSVPPPPSYFHYARRVPAPPASRAVHIHTFGPASAFPPLVCFFARPLLFVAVAQYIPVTGRSTSASVHVSRRVRLHASVRA